MKRLIFASLSIWLTGCAMSQGLAGRVSDQRGAPVAGAWVIALWKQEGGVVTASTLCRHVDVTRSNRDGGFELPKYSSSKLFSDPYPELVVVKEGYSPAIQPPYPRVATPEKYHLRLNDAPDREAYLREMRNVQTYTSGCGEDDDSKFNVYEFHKWQCDTRQLPEAVRDRGCIAILSADVLNRDKEYHTVIVNNVAVSQNVNSQDRLDRRVK